VHKTRFVAVAPIVAAMLAAGCGSSSSSSTSASQPSSAAATSASTSSSAASAPYGHSAGGSAATAAAALIATKHDKLGTILSYGPKRLTVYLFEGDKGRSSSCTGACASVWPPVTGKPQPGGAAMVADLGTITRPDGTTQVTYKGHPLYLYVKDKDGGDTYGQGLNSFGANWYVLSPSGQKVDLS
jgi:predicted lipoprotein with Yx(FWY)xxD motif